MKLMNLMLRKAKSKPIQAFKAIDSAEIRAFCFCSLSLFTTLTPVQFPRQFAKTAEKCFKLLIIKTVTRTQERVRNDDGKIIHLLWRFLNNKLAFSISNLIF